MWTGRDCQSEQYALSQPRESRVCQTGDTYLIVLVAKLLPLENPFSESF